MSEDNICPHGETVYKDPCPRCTAEFQALPSVEGMTPEERSAEVIRLLQEPGWAGFGPIWERIDELVGRGTFTHELARPDLLAREALHREHPANLAAHLIGLADQLMGDKPVIVIRDDK